MDAIVAAVARRGADGCGKDGLDGYMFMLASTSCRRFGILLGRTLWSKMQPGRDKDDGPEKGARSEVGRTLTCNIEGMSRGTFWPR
jgi:hypothetical protein